VSEQDREGTSSGATRSQHVVLQGPADMRMMMAAMRSGVERSRTQGAPAAPTMLVITPTVEQAQAAADVARTLLGDSGTRVVPVSGVARARRVLGAAPVSIVTGTAADLLQLRRDAALDLEGLQTVAIIGLDDVLAAHGADALQALLGDAPSEVSRVATLDTDHDGTEAFLDAQLHRARRLTPVTPADSPLAVAPQYILTPAAGRRDVLRLLLDELDPPSLVIVAGTAEAQAEVADALERLGVPVDGTAVQVVAQPTAEHVALTVLWESPATADALVAAVAMRPVHAIALLLPEELPAFQRLAGGVATVWTPVARKIAAEDRVAECCARHAVEWRGERQRARAARAAAGSFRCRGNRLCGAAVV